MFESFTINYSRTKESMESPKTTNGYFTYFRGCYDSLKNAIKDYSTYTSKYEPYHKRYYAADAGFNPYYVPVTTMSMKSLLNAKAPPSKRLKTMASNIADNITHTFIYGAYTFTSLILPENKLLQNKKSRPNQMNEIDFGFTFIDSPPELNNNNFNHIKNMEDTINIKNAISSAINEPFISNKQENNQPNNQPNNQHNNQHNQHNNQHNQHQNYHHQNHQRLVPNNSNVEEALSSAINESFIYQNKNIPTQERQERQEHQRIPSKRTFDDTWGFVNDDLSILYKNTFSPPKPPRRVFTRA